MHNKVHSRKQLLFTILNQPVIYNELFAANANPSFFSIKILSCFNVNNYKEIKFINKDFIYVTIDVHNITHNILSLCNYD